MNPRTPDGSALRPLSVSHAAPADSGSRSQTPGALISKIPFIRPSFPGPAELAEDFAEIAHANWYTNFGPKERKFARALGDYLGPDRHVATLANGTMALIAALHVTFGPGMRDRYLLMPSFTFVGVAQAALWTGYRPWFIDIDADTWQPCALSARAVLERSRDRIAGILLANVFGVGNPQIDAWEDLAAEWELPIVLDSAAGFGSAYADGERLGGRGACEVFSFHATKPFAVGEGGALVSRDPRLIEQAYKFQNFGLVKTREAIQLGMNGKLQEISAAIGLRQLAGLDRRLASRRKVLEYYRAGLAGVGVRFQNNADASSLCFASACCQSADHKAAIMASLQMHAIEARDYYNPPQHLHPYFVTNPELAKSTDLSVTTNICSRIVSLPVHDHMASVDVARVVAAVQEGAVCGD
ncbi:dTDP-4-amino-4,6-dideoxy-D-glucose transaminase [Mycobacterium simulans]|uniref:dTDP-4-amino-4,6-dideoxy-D-glucose transaminase n=1 Tax=Mycobacterium simulans TaxID=627089 RepID=A0A7Z7IJ17_9MYCO|nr:dTDP-4-amino-4,6-dideoxy-D-glucose transaminase [Mycobacterium simulans]